MAERLTSKFAELFASSTRSLNDVLSVLVVVVLVTED